MQQMEANPEDRSLQLHFLSTVTGLFLSSTIQQIILTKSLNILQENIRDTDFQKAFFNYLKKYKFSEADRRGIYKSVLGMLMVDSTPIVKQFVLEVARWHYTIQRKDGKLTIYDENAIQNDILMHSA